MRPCRTSAAPEKTRGKDITNNDRSPTANWPPVLGLCPTYGRFERLRDAAACFLLQDYPGRKRLLVLNDAPEPIPADGLPPEITVINRPERYPTLGHKRQALLEKATSPPLGGLAAHWDDDDLYLPWHLTECVRRWAGRPEARCVKPRSAWFAVGPRGGFEVRGPRRNVFEGQMLFELGRALELGGYPPLQSGQAKALLDAFRDTGELHTWDPAARRVSYVYRWGDGLCHCSGTGSHAGDAAAHQAANEDHADGRSLVPGGHARRWAARRVGLQFRRLARGAAKHLTDGAARALNEAIQDSLRLRQRDPAGD
ncbi:MAG: hypothetical protein ACOC7T_05705 [Planctomycetota bacterium]